MSVAKGLLDSFDRVKLLLEGVETGRTGPSSGKFEHNHTYRFDTVKKAGMTLTTEGDGPKHEHKLEWCEKCAVVHVMDGGVDGHDHPHIKLED